MTEIELSEKAKAWVEKPCPICQGKQKAVQLMCNPVKGKHGHLQSVGVIDAVFCTQCGAPSFCEHTKIP